MASQQRYVENWTPYPPKCSEEKGAINYNHALYKYSISNQFNMSEKHILLLKSKRDLHIPII